MFELLAKLSLILTLLAGMITPVQDTKLGAIDQEEPLYAHVENGIVDAVIVIKPETIEEKNGWEVNGVFQPKKEWLQTSSKGTIRKNYAGKGYTYDKNRDAFIAPKPTEDAVLDEITLQWKRPAPTPSATSS